MNTPAEDTPEAAKHSIVPPHWQENARAIIAGAKSLNTVEREEAHGKAIMLLRILIATQDDTVFRAVAAERERIAKRFEETYRNEEGEALRATFIEPDAKDGYLQAWHQASDIADFIREVA